MAINLGLDIGAISIKLAGLGAPGDRRVLEALGAGHPGFRLTALGERPLVLSEYRRIAGSPIQSAYDLLREFYAAVPEPSSAGGAASTCRRRPHSSRVRAPAATSRNTPQPSK